MTRSVTQPVPQSSREQAPQRPPALAIDLVERGYHPGKVDLYAHELHERVRRAEEALGTALRAADKKASTPAGRELIGDLLRMALDEIEGNRAQAVADAAKMIEDARSAARDARGAAQRESDGMVAGAREQSNTILADARTEAKRITDEATAHATAVHEAAERRMQAVANFHQATLTRVGIISEATAKLLREEEGRGPVEGEVARLMGIAPAAVVSAEAAELPAPGSGS